MENIPAELCALKQWVVWRMPDKEPRRAAAPTRAAKSNDPTTWSTYEQAVAASDQGVVDGVGFVFTVNDPYIGIDIDDCLDAETGEMNPVAAQIVTTIPTYWEVSPSGTGLHGILRGDMPPNAGRVAYLDGQKVEVYPDGRYFTMTGQRLGNVDVIAECQPHLEALCMRLWPKKDDEGSPPQQAPAVSLGDQELLELMGRSANGPEIDALLRGDSTSRNGDRSANDLSACTYLAWWTNSDPDQMDRVFRGSARMRPKWDERHYANGRTYGQVTIEKAIARNGGKGYSAGKQGRQQEKRRQTRAAEEAAAPLVLEAALAAVLASVWRGTYRWSSFEGRWRRWTGSVWRKEPEPVVVNAAQKILRAHYGHLLAQPQPVAEDKRLHELHKLTCRYASVLGGLAFLRGEPGFHTGFEEWDADPYTVNCADGLLDVNTQVLRPHDPPALCTKIARWSFAVADSTGAWKRHLERCLPDEDVRRQVQRDLGRAMVGAALEESLSLWYGRGANGKSTTVRAIQMGFDEYAKQAVKDLLVASKFERHTTDLADLAGSRLVFGEEIEAGKPLDVAMVKNLTSGGRKKARFMRGDNFEFEQTFSLFLLVNDKPVITSTDLGTWRRVRLVEWTESIPFAEQRPQDDVVAELAADGAWMLRWMAAGFADWQADHHWVAEAVRAATAEYEAEQDIIAGFLSRRCALNAHATVSVDQLHEAYMIDLMENGDEGVERLTKIAFGKRLKTRNLSQFKATGGVRMWRGITLAATSGKNSVRST